MDRCELEGDFFDAFGDSDVDWDDEPEAQNSEGERELDSDGPEPDGAAENVPQNDAWPPNKRQFFSRDKKLAVLTWHRKNNASKGETARHFSLPHHNYVSHWLAQEDQLRQHSRNTRCIGSGRRADWPELEQQLHGEFKEQRAKGLKVKAWWFKNKADQLFRELYPTKVNDDRTIPFLNSKHWFEQFQNRFSVSLRATTNRASEEPERKLQLVREFHASIIAAGEFSPENIGNMDDTFAI